MSKINTNKEQPDLLGSLFKRIPEEELPASFPFERNATNHA